MAEEQKLEAVPRKGDRYHHGNLREELLAAAEVELTEKGIEGLSLRGIAKRAGVSHAAPAHHFGDVGGLLTALAAVGFQRFVAFLDERQVGAGSDPGLRMQAAGLGYIDFALAYPALFQLIFSSRRPDFADPALSQAANAAFDQLVRSVGEAKGNDPYAEEAGMVDVMATWATVHGLAGLLNTGRLKPLLSLPESKRQAVLAEIISRAWSAA
jgi:AcrR family transcriptional regulator